MAFTMQPVLTSSPPIGAEWRYEVKYDGYRCILRIHSSGVTLTSRNGVELSSTFPEITQFAKTAFQHMEKELPLTLDGEIVCLVNPCRADFEHLQVRGRLKRPDKIQESANARPCCFLAFDLLERSGEDVTLLSYLDRKNRCVNSYPQQSFLHLQILTQKKPFNPFPVMIILINSGRW